MGRDRAKGTKWTDSRAFLFTFFSHVSLICNKVGQDQSLGAKLVPGLQKVLGSTIPSIVS